MAQSQANVPAPPSHASDGSHHEWSKVPWVTGGAAALVAAGIFLSLLMGSLDQFVVLNALGTIVGDFGQPNAITYVVSAYLITSTVAVPIFARLSDIVSRRDVFLVGMGIFILGSILAGLSQNLNELILFRGVQGFGSGCFFPVGISIIAVAFDPARRARLTGAFSGVFGIATVAGPFVGDYIVRTTTWRWVFYINIPIGVLGMALIAVSLGALRPEVRERFDWIGAVILGAWVGPLTFALFQVSNAGWAWSDPRVLALLVTTAVLLPVFVVFELRTAKPLVPLRLLRDKVVAASGTAAALSRGAIFSLLTIVTVYVFIVLYGASATGAETDATRDLLYFMVIPMVFGALIGGQALTRTSYRVLVSSGLAIAGAGLFLLTFITSSTPLWTFAYGFLPTGGLVLPLMPIGFGLGLTFGPTTIAVQFRVPPKDIGQATGLIQFLGTLGASLALPLLSSYQTTRFAQLGPAAPSGACLLSPPCAAAYHQSVLNAAVQSYVEVFSVMFALVVLAFVASLFLSGRMPKHVPGRPAAGTGAAPAPDAAPPSLTADVPP
jgi:EmrB/QacA subfamily drug resistance transporter